MPTARAFIALGANLGDREANIRRALAALDAGPDIRVVQASALLENPAVGGPPDSPAFLNAVAEIETSLEPEPLLDRLLEIERQLGRVRKHKWEPRVIDLDILLYGDKIIQTPALQIPHPLMHERPFVLQPLAQIAPDVIHPVTNKSSAELLRSL
jgi:2-amino-4-hydroxy-6-hydroxymethyldihydropteridine diphosphokinase